ESGLAFRLPPWRRRPEVDLSRLHTRPARPLSTLRLPPREGRRMTRGRCGSLGLHRVTLTFTAPRRFIPAHGGGRRDPLPFNSARQRLPKQLGGVLRPVPGRVLDLLAAGDAGGADRD